VRQTLDGLTSELALVSCRQHTVPFLTLIELHEPSSASSHELAIFCANRSSGVRFLLQRPPRLHIPRCRFLGYLIRCFQESKTSLQDFLLKARSFTTYRPLNRGINMIIILSCLLFYHFQRTSCFLAVALTVSCCQALSGKHAGPFLQPARLSTGPPLQACEFLLR